MGFIFSLLATAGFVGTAYGAWRWWQLGRRHQNTGGMRKLTLIAAAVMIGGSTGFGIVDTAATNAADAVRVQKQLKQQKAKAKTLEAKLKGAKQDAKTLDGQYTVLADAGSLTQKEVASSSEASSKRAEKASSEAASKSSAEKASSEAESQRKAEAASQAAAASSTAAAQAQQAQQAQQQAQAQAPTQAPGDTYTGNSQKIIGNSRSKIYHVPGQAGYHMNSANAVYFDSEAQAQASGYRRSQR